MPSRAGNWQLLDHSSDPVAGDPDQLLDLISYYRTMADTIMSEAAILKRIGDGDTTQFEGKAADALRSRSHDVAKSLDQASTRYVAVGTALQGYAPALDQARADSLLALQDAEAASVVTVAAAALPNPVAGRTIVSPPLTDEETTDLTKRTNAMKQASEEVTAAKNRLHSVLDTLNDAGRRASSIINDAINHDGLRDTWQYLAREGWLKFLKILVKILTWIGVALAVIGFFIPGLQGLALAGFITAGLSVFTSVTLAAMGEGSWLDVVFSVVGVLTLGAGGLVTKAVKGVQGKLLEKVLATAVKPSAKQAEELAEHISQVKQVVQPARDEVTAMVKAGTMTEAEGATKLGKLDAAVEKAGTYRSDSFTDAAHAKVAETFKAKPSWWQPRGDGYITNDIGKIKDVLKGDYQWQRLVSIDQAQKYKQLQDIARESYGIESKIQPFWHYANGGRVVFGWSNNAFKLVANPTGFGTDTGRFPAYDNAKASMKTPVI